MTSPRLEIDGTTTLDIQKPNRRIVQLADAAHRLADAVAQGQSLDDALGSYLRANPELAVYFKPGGAPHEHVLKDELLYPHPRPGERNFVSRGAEEQIDVALPTPGAANAVGEVLRVASGGTHTVEEAREALLEREVEQGVELLGALLEAGHVGAVRSPERRRETFRAPGMYRLQHASVLFRTEQAGVIVDPHFHSKYRTSAVTGDYSRADLEGHLDCVLISHSHEDHLSWSTLLQLPRDTPIVVPRVPRETLLCPAMADRLRDFGFRRVLEPEWFSAPIQIGDIQICVLPFYGEQPLVDDPLCDPDLRNWGNTYLVKTPDCSAWLLVDSGRDALGAMTEIAARVAETHGPIDVVLSNLRTFPYSPFQISGLGEYWWVLNRQQMEAWPSYRGQITLGPTGVAEVCKNARARAFLPYAHLWHTPGERVEGLDDGTEGALVSLLSGELARLDAPTEIATWGVGCRARLGSRGRIAIDGPTTVGGLGV